MNERRAAMPAEIDDREAFLARKAGALRALAKTVVRDVIEIGRLLSEAKEAFGRGENPEFLAWAQEALGWSRSSVYRFMDVHALMRNGQFSQRGKIEDLDLSSLYLLARPSTADDVRDEVVERAANGEAITPKEVARLIDEARKRDRFAAKKELERRLAREQAKADTREREIRAEYADKLVFDMDELKAKIAKISKPLQARIKQLEDELRRRAEASSSLEKIDEERMKATKGNSTPKEQQEVMERLKENATTSLAQLVHMLIARSGDPERWAEMIYGKADPKYWPDNAVAPLNHATLEACAKVAAVLADKWRK